MFRRIVGTIIIWTLSIGLYALVLIKIMQSFAIDNSSVLLVLLATSLILYKNNILNLLFGKKNNKVEKQAKESNKTLEDKG